MAELYKKVKRQLPAILAVMDPSYQMTRIMVCRSLKAIGEPIYTFNEWCQRAENYEGWEQVERLWNLYKFQDLDTVSEAAEKLATMARVRGWEG